MSSLHKYRARKPMQTDAIAIGSQTYSAGSASYRIDFHPRGSDPEFHAILTRAEMLQCVSTWMAAEHRDEVTAESARKKALTTGKGPT